jgi:transient receptor potential cation channel subfamily A protein 1
MSGAHRFKNTSKAVASFIPGTSKDSQPANVPKKKKKSRSSLVSLELVRNLSTDLDPYQLAEIGDLDSLKAFFESFGVTIKERDNNRATLLHHAAAANQIEVMGYLIDSGIELDATDKDGHTALHTAVIQGHIEATNLLLDSGIDDTILDKDSDAALHIVMRQTDTRLLSTFLEHPNIDLVVPGYRKRTPLHIVAEIDNVEAASVLHNSVMVNEHYRKKTSFRLCATDADDLTPIHLAARKGSYKVLDLFMTKCKGHGYPPEVVLGFIDEENSTPLHAAIDGGFTEVVEVLLKHGADPVASKEDHVPPFLLACSQGKLEMIKAMLDSNNHEDVINCKDVYGQMCLHHCARGITSSHIMPYLVQRGAKVNSADNKGQTPMMAAIVAGSTSSVNTLLELGADVVVKDNNGKNALHHAIFRKRRKIGTLLVDLPSASTLVVDVDEDRNSPIHLALKHGVCSLVSPMIRVIKCKLKNVKDSEGNNYLHLAANGGNWRALTVLLEIPECLKLLNETNEHGGTPLHSAAWFGYLRCAEVLLSHGAMTHKCYNGLTPFTCAAYRGHTEVARILFNAHPFQLKWTDDKGSNALHWAAIGGNPQVIKLLLDIGVPITHNFELESFFDRLILKNHVKGAAAAIEHDRYEECLDLVSPNHPHPMVNLITQMPEIAKKVLDRSHSTASLAAASPDYWESFDFKYLRLRGPRHSTEEVDGMGEDDPAKAMVADEKETMNPHVVKYKGSSPSNNQLKECPKLSHMKTLQTMVQYDRSSLLTHPVSNAYLKSKWRHYGRWFHIILSSFVFFQVLFLSIFTVVIPNPSLVQESLGAGCGNETNGTFVPCPEFSAGANVCRFITISFALLNFIAWLFIVIQLRLELFYSVNNVHVLVDLFSVGFTIYYLVPSRGLNNANWEGGAVAIFFAWFSLVLKIQLFDLFGVYVTMFLAITRRAFQVLLICFFFVISFGLSFYILTGNLKQYSTIGYSLFVNFGHLLGEIDYEGFVEEDVDGNLNFHWLTFTFVVALAILMGIVIMNLLIGLAVGDIDEIRTNAIAEKKTFEVKFFCKLDTIIPSRLLWYLDAPSVTKYPNHQTNFVRKLWHFFWLSLKGEDASLSDDDASSDDHGIDHKSNELSRLRDKVEELQHSQSNIQNTLNQMKEVQESLMKLMMAAREENEDPNNKAE